MVKNPPAIRETQVQSLGQDDPLEKGVATTPVGDPGSIPGEGSVYPLQYFCLENSMERGVWQAMVHGLEKRTEQLN